MLLKHSRLSTRPLTLIIRADAATTAAEPVRAATHAQDAAAEATRADAAEHAQARKAAATATAVTAGEEPVRVLIPEADAAEPVQARKAGATATAAAEPARVPTPEADAAVQPGAVQMPAAATKADEAARKLLPDAERRAAAKAIRRKTADPERIRSITKTTRISPARTEQDVSSVPRRRKKFLQKSRSRQFPFPRRSPSATLQSACTCRLPRS